MAQHDNGLTIRTRGSNLRLAILTGMVLAILLGNRHDQAWAATDSWLAGVSGNWFDAGNWSAGVPGPADDAIIPSTNSTTALISGATGATANSLSIDNGGVTVGNISAGSLTVAGTIAVGTFGANGKLTLTLGTISANGLSVGATGSYSDAAGNTIILTGSNPTIQMAANVNVIVNSTITGANGLTKDGLGTLTLTGSNTYSGGTTISNGTLQVGNSGITGSLGGGDVTNNGALVFKRSDGIIVDNAISGTGSVAQAGSGTLILLGTNTYSGSTTINGGTLQVGNGGTNGTLGTGAVIDNSVLVFDHSDDLVVSNAISGGGSFVQNGSNTLTLVGTNTYSGSTTINAGTLVVGDGGTNGSLGTGPVIDNSALVFNRSDSNVVASTISGSGSLTQTGTGILILSGGNTYTGLTVISSGTLQVGNGGASGSLGRGAVSNNSALVFDRSDNIVVSNLISGVGSLNQAGTGLLTLTNVNTYSGGTWISNGGTLAVRDSHALGSGDLNLLKGTLALNTMTVNVGGNFTQTSNGVLAVSIGNTNVFGQLAVAGSATLDGTLRLVQANNFLPRPNETFVVLTASNGVTGTFAALTNGFATISALLNPQLTYNADDVTLKWAQSSFVPFALTHNQAVVARDLDAVASSMISSAVALVNFLDYVPNPTNSLPIAFNQIAPEELAAIFTISLADMDVLGNQFLKRASELRAGYHGLYTDLYNQNSPDNNTAANNSNSSLVVPSPDIFRQSIDNPWGVYLEAIGEFVNVQGNTNASGYHQASGGLVLGIDRRISDQLVLGGAFSYFSDGAALSQKGKITADETFAQLYGVWFKDGYHVEGTAGAGYNSYTTKRQGLQGFAKGDTTGEDWGGLLSGGYDWQQQKWSFGPVGEIQYENVGIDPYREKGSLAPLHIQGQSMDALHSQLGGAVRYRGNIPGTWSFITPELNLAWRHDFYGNTVPLSAHLASGAGGVFTVNGPNLGSDSMVGTVGVTIQWVPTFSTYVNITAGLGRTGYEAETISGGMRYDF
jgi:autotransporter-associated beta strand protein